MQSFNNKKMEKVILTLLTSVLCVMLAEAQFLPRMLPLVDTLPRTVVNDLEVIPVKTTITYSDSSKEIIWKLHVPEFEKSFQNFENKYPGCISDPVSEEILENISDWREDVWNKVVPVEIKTLAGKYPSDDAFSFQLYIDKEGRVFAAEFMMSNDVFEALNTLPLNMMKNFYHNLLKEKCKAIEQVEFCLNLDEINNKTGKEFIMMRWHWYLYNKFGTCHPAKLQKMLDDGTMEKIFNGEKKK